MAKKIPDLALGLLPTDLINATLDLELDPGEAVFTGGAQFHARRNHGGEFDQVLPHVRRVVANPLYLRDDFKNDGKIELIGRAEAGTLPILVAVKITCDADGKYHVVTAYRVSEATIEARRNSGHLKIAKKKGR